MQQPIKQYLVVRGLSQTDLAKELDISKQAVQQWVSAGEHWVKSHGRTGRVQQIRVKRERIVWRA